MDESRISQHKLTAQEKELREWLVQQPNGLHKWMVVKAGFRRSYFQGIEDGKRM